MSAHVLLLLLLFWCLSRVTVGLFVSQVSQISSVFDCLLEEEERSLKENPIDSVQWAEVVLTVNSIIKVKTKFYPLIKQMYFNDVK